MLILDLVGAGHSWDLVVLHHFPMERRVKDTARMLTNTQVLIIHDTDNPALTTSRFPLPADLRFKTRIQNPIYKFHIKTGKVVNPCGMVILVSPKYQT